MDRASRWRRVRPWTAAALVLAVVGWLASVAVRADCLHVVVSKADRARPAGANLEHLNPAGGLFATPTDEPRTPARRRGPCTGALCSRGPDRPGMPAPPAPTRVDLWGCLLPGAPLLSSHSTMFPLDDPVARPVHHGLAIERPPRRLLPADPS
jgi:hypothetical protein